MKRFVLFIFLFSFLALSAVWLAGAAPISVMNSKHNLSSISTSGTGSIKSVDAALGGTTEVCVFCHTPHGGNTQAPLWNKTASVGSYSTYTSDVLAGLVYWAAEDPKSGAGVVPHVKTRICLSCHDGTIALGSLVNLPPGVTTQIPMDGTAGTNKMPPTAAGYIGLELNDDHPVAIKHDTSDPELTSIPLLAKVRLYRESDAVPTKANLDYVECTSCHDAHDNQWGNFLVESNQNSALCLRCHRKEGFTGSAHEINNTVAYAPPTGAPVAGGNPTNHGPMVGNVKCMSCHFPHKAGVTSALPTTPNPTSGKYLLSFQEEASCFNDNDRFGQTNVAACHGNSAPAGQRSIEPALSSASRHNMANYANKHQSMEVNSGTSNGWFSPTAWHVECEDCHNPHTAGTALHTQGTNTISPTSSLYGVAYASVSGGYPAGNWSAPVTFSPVEPLGATFSTLWGATPVKEYEVCFKCHSNFASGGGSFPNAYTSLQQMSDQSKEFNVNNAMGSFHSVVTSNTNTWGAMINGWNTGSQLMYCSDCHTKEGLNRPKGSHGSSNGYILSYLYYDDKAAVGVNPDDAAGTLCLQCHDPNTYSTGIGANTGFYTTGGTNLHTQHYTVRNNPVSAFAYRCVNCHIRTSHGWDRKGMIHRQGDNASHANGNWYEPVSGPTITGLNLPASRGYAHGNANKNVDCQTIIGCH